MMMEKTSLKTSRKQCWPMSENKQKKEGLRLALLIKVKKVMEVSQKQKEVELTQMCCNRYLMEEMTKLKI